MNKSSIQKQIQKLAPRINQPQQFVQELELLFNSWGSEKAIAESKRIIPNVNKIFGVNFSIQNILAKEISNMSLPSAKAMLRLLEVLWQSRSLEAQIVVSKALGKLGKKAPDESLNLIASFLPDIKNWAVCDTLATQGIRGLMPTHNDRILALALKCIKNKNKWIKRFAVVTIVELAHNKKLEIPKKVFDIIKPLITAEDADVKKAVAWALREISKREPKMVKNFLKDYQNSQDKNVQWVVKEGSKKL